MVQIEKPVIFARTSCELSHGYKLQAVVPYDIAIGAIISNHRVVNREAILCLRQSHRLGAIPTNLASL